MFNSITCHLEYQANCNPDKIAFVDEKGDISFSKLRNKAYGISLSIIELGYIRKPIIVFLDTATSLPAKSFGLVTCLFGLAISL